MAVSSWTVSTMFSGFVLRLTWLEPMRGASEDEQDDDFIADMKSTSKPSKLSRTVRAERLRKMMDDEGG